MALAAILPQPQAQGLKASGSSAADIVPAGWESIFTTGDLNADGIADLVLIATPCDKEKMKIRNDGYVYNFNQPVLAVYWGLKNGTFKLFKQYDKAIPARESEFLSITPAINITKRGTLEISLEFFASAGSWTQPTTTHTFRYQDNDFFLIGKDVNELVRNTGETIETSENYLTRKRIVTTMSTNSKRPAVKKTRLPKNQLKSLGFNLNDL